MGYYKLISFRNLSPAKFYYAFFFPHSLIVYTHEVKQGKNIGIKKYIMEEMLTSKFLSKTGQEMKKKTTNKFNVI